MNKIGTSLALLLMSVSIVLNNNNRIDTRPIHCSSYYSRKRYTDINWWYCLDFGNLCYIYECGLLNIKDLIIPLINEFDNSEDLFLAKAILDVFTCNIPPWGTKSKILQNLFDMSQDDFEFYKTSNLRKHLRYHKNAKAEPVTDIRERAVRRRFDSMIYFFLSYNICIGLDYSTKRSFTILDIIWI